MNVFRILVLLVALSSVAFTTTSCGETDDQGSNEPTENNTPGEENPNGSDEGGDGVDFTCDKKKQEAAPVAGRFWKSSDAKYDFTEKDATDAKSGVADAEVKLVLSGTKTLTGKTCSDGWFAFPTIDDSFEYGVLNYGRNDCKTANCPTNFASKVEKGESIKILAFGDSIGALSEDGSSDVRYPEQLAKIAGNVATVTLENVAVSGSTTVQWAPSGEHHDKITEADVYVFTLSGNDFLSLLYGIDPNNLAAALAALAKIGPLKESSIKNIKAIVDDIRDRYPNADIIMANYPNYGYTSKFKKEVPLAYLGMARSKVSETMTGITESVAGYKKLMVADLYNYIESKRGENIDEYVYDGVHLSNMGHEVYAKRIFYTLGGWHKNDFGDRHFVGFE